MNKVKQIYKTMHDHLGRVRDVDQKYPSNYMQKFKACSK